MPCHFPCHWIGTDIVVFLCSLFSVLCCLMACCTQLEMRLIGNWGHPTPQPPFSFVFGVCGGRKVPSLIDPLHPSLSVESQFRSLTLIYASTIYFQLPNRRKRCKWLWRQRQVYLPLSVDHSLESWLDLVFRDRLTNWCNFCFLRHTQNLPFLLLFIVFGSVFSVVTQLCKNWKGPSLSFSLSLVFVSEKWG